MAGSSHTRSKLARLIFDNSLLLVAGTIAAVTWANLDLASYDRITHPLHFWVNDVGMAFFFALAAKEVFEATLPGGPLASPRHALSPLAAAVGGMVAPAAIYLTLTSTVGPTELSRGWAIPCATDIAFSAMTARVIFSTGHPAIPFLLLLAIADDALGLIILAVFYPSGPLSIIALATLMAGAVLAALWLQRLRIRSFWPYVIGPGALSWAALHLGGFHPALALVPVVPFMPHSSRDLGLFDPREELQVDTLNQFEHWWATPVQFGPVAVWIGECRRPRSSKLGGGRTSCWPPCCLASRSASCCFLARRDWWALPHGLYLRDLFVVGIAAAIGFTVSLFFATAAFTGGAALAETKMGALLSFIAAPLALIVSRLFRGRAS